MKKPNLKNRPFVFSGLILVLLAVYGAYKTVYLAENPSEPKDCPPLDLLTSMEVGSETASGVKWAQLGGLVNDASCVDETAVYGVVKVTSEKDISEALSFAREHKLPVSMAGVRHSMGGQAFAKHGVVLDMTSFNKVELSESSKTITVQSGATWHQIQNIIHPKFAVKAMQSTDIFTVGGSISVNAHGMDHHAGALEGTIHSLRFMKADGNVVTLSRTQNAELYNLVVGGYGLFGVILDATLDVVDNDVYETERAVIPTSDFLDYFAKNIKDNPELGLFYGHMSTSPGSLLDEMILYKYKKVDSTGATIAPLADVGSVRLRRFVINLAKEGSLFQRLKWFTEKNLEPHLESCTVTRAQAMKDGEACLVSRNDPMHDSVPYLKNDHKGETDILHEYFIPRDQLLVFNHGMKEIFEKHDVNLLNASVRVVNQEHNFLSYAPKEAFSVVLYINQSTDAEGNEKMRQVTSELIDLSTKVGGKFFLPYQLHYTNEQLHQAYPQIGQFFAEKKKYDPSELFSNTFYAKYKTP